MKEIFKHLHNIAEIFLAISYDYFFLSFSPNKTCLRVVYHYFLYYKNSWILFDLKDCIKEIYELFLSTSALKRTPLNRGTGL